MKRWLSKLSGRFFATTKQTKNPGSSVATQDDPNVCSAEVKSPLQIKTLGDVINHSCSLEELEKKEVGAPLLHNTGNVEDNRRGRAQPPLDSDAVTLDVPPVEFKVASSSNTEHQEDSPAIYTKEEAVNTGGFKKWLGIAINKVRSRLGRSDKDNNTYTIREYAIIASVDQVSYHRPTDDEARNPIPITPGGEVNSALRHVSDICESEKVSDGNASVLLTRLPPELHRSSESLNESLISPRDPERTPLRRCTSAQFNVPKIAQDSQIFNTIPRDPTCLPIWDAVKSEIHSIPASQTDRVEVDQSVCTKEMIASIKTPIPVDSASKVDSTYHKPADMVVKSSTNTKTTCEASAERTKRRLRKKDKGKKIRKSKSPKRVEHSQYSSDQPAYSGKVDEEAERRAALRQRANAEVESDANRNSSWKNRGSSQDRKVRYRFSKGGTHSSIAERSRNDRIHSNCRRSAPKIKCPNRSTNHTLAPNISPSARAQSANGLAKQADVVVEEFVDGLARDMVCSVLTRASYAKSLSNRSNRRTAMLLRALKNGRHKRAAKIRSVSNSHPHPQRIPSPLED